MHGAVKQFVKNVRKDIPYKFRLRRVLEIGSHNINGSIRSLFRWRLNRYTGVDISKGKGVDIVGNFNDIPFHNQFGVVISLECAEHDKDWQESLLKMYDLLEAGGLMIFTCAGPNRPEHGTTRTSPKDSPDTNDYYGNLSIEDFESVLPRELFDMYILDYARGKNDLQFYGIKNKNTEP